LKKRIEKKAETYVKIAVTFVVKGLILITLIIVLVLVNRDITDDANKLLLLQEAQETCSPTMSNRICRRTRNVTRVSLTHDMKKEKQDSAPDTLGKIAPCAAPLETEYR
jgi:hypothetical protein